MNSYIVIEEIKIPFLYQGLIEATKNCEGFQIWKKRYKGCQDYASQKDLLENLNVAKLFLDVGLKVELEAKVIKNGRNPDLRIYEDDSTLFYIEVTRFRIDAVDEEHDKVKSDIVTEVKKMSSCLCFDFCFKRRLRYTDNKDLIINVAKTIINKNKEISEFDSKYLIYENFSYKQVDNMNSEENNILCGMVVRYSDYCIETTYLGMRDDFNIYTGDEINKFYDRVFTDKYRQLPEGYPGIIVIKDDSLHRDFKYLNDAFYKALEVDKYNNLSVVVHMSNLVDNDGNQINKLRLNNSASKKLSKKETDLIKKAFKISNRQ